MLIFSSCTNKPVEEGLTAKNGMVVSAREEASKIGIYTPVDYANNPVTYCGMTIDNTPMNL